MTAASQLSARMKSQAFYAIYAVLAVLLSSFLYFSYSSDIEKIQKKMVDGDANYAKSLIQHIQQQVDGQVSDARFFANFFARQSQRGDIFELDLSALDQAKNGIYGEFVSYLAYRQVFSHIYFLNQNGQEVAVVRFEGGLPLLTSQSQLGNQKESAFFQKAMSLPEGDVFIALAPKKVGSGKILQIAVPVFGLDGNSLGVIIVGYDMEVLGSQLAETFDRSNLETFLLDQHKEVFFDLKLGSDSYVKEQYVKGLMSRFSELEGLLNKSGSGHSKAQSGYFYWQSYALRNEEKRVVSDDAWTLVFFRSHEIIDRGANEIRDKYISWGMVLLFLIFVSFVVLHNYRRARQENEYNEKILQEARVFTGELLESAFNSESLEQEMDRIIGKILELSWLSLLPKGSIFITDEDSGNLVMVAQKGLAEPLLQSCAVIKPGQCLCGRAAQTKQTVFKSCLDDDHEIRFEGITEHGHICMPIMQSDKALGVLNLYVNHGMEFKPIYRDILMNITQALASIIDNKTTHEELVAANREMQRQTREIAYERQVVEDTLLRIRSSEQFDVVNIRYLQNSVDKTAGDILLSSACSNGKHRYLLGDFTGHGLASALSGPTVADIFYAMSRKGLPSSDILNTINEKLVSTLPVHLYLAAGMVEYDVTGRKVKIWNAGLPEVLLFRDDKLHQKVVSAFMPLGIAGGLDFEDGCVEIDVVEHDCVYVYSDGITEAPNLAEEMYGQDRFVELLTKVLKEDLPLEYVMDEVSEFTVHTSQADDITLLEVNIRDKIGC